MPDDTQLLRDAAKHARKVWPGSFGEWVAGEFERYARMLKRPQVEFVVRPHRERARFILSLPVPPGSRWPAMSDTRHHLLSALGGNDPADAVATAIEHIIDTAAKEIDQQQARIDAALALLCDQHETDCHEHTSPGCCPDGCDCRIGRACRALTGDTDG